MGLLSLGTPLEWEECRKFADHVRHHGIQQFLHVWHKTKERQNDVLLWGDEIEYMVVLFDEKSHKARLSSRAHDVLKQLQKEEKINRESNIKPKANWFPEYAIYMIEGTPGMPYPGTMKDFLLVEANMRYRRQAILSLLNPNESILTLTSFPQLGCHGFFHPYSEVNGIYSKSLFVPDEAISIHARFSTLTANIRKRRKGKVAINVPIFHDQKTPTPFLESLPKSDEIEHPLPDHIYMDCMCYGMGCCCLQVTFQCCNVQEARQLYDQLAILAPLMLTISAASPIYRGYLSDIDCRWRIISMAVDDRTEEERGLKPLEHDRFVINKSRYDSIDCYISNECHFKPEYNDLPLVYDTDIYEELLFKGVDHLLARHLAHLFIRDPLVVYREILEQDDTKSLDHFENIQSTNWQTVRFKPPPHDSGMGWRVEFRPMEVQLTDFENAAYVIFVVLLTRAILSFNLNFYIPISKVDENMKNAHKRNAVIEEQFYFRKNIFISGSCIPNFALHFPQCQSTITEEEPYFELMTIKEIFNGKPPSFPGLIPLVQEYLNTIQIDIYTRCHISRYIDVIKKRANGDWPTTASWMRQFVHHHPDYHQDSIVSDKVAYDLLQVCREIGDGEIPYPPAPTTLASVHPQIFQTL